MTFTLKRACARRKNYDKDLKQFFRPVKINDLGLGKSFNANDRTSISGHGPCIVQLSRTLLYMRLIRTLHQNL